MPRIVDSDRGHPKSARSPRRPFGKLEQRELAYLRLLGATAIERWIFVVLRVRANGATGRVSDGIPALCDWSGLGPTAMKAGLKHLKALGVIKRDPHSFKSGERGRAWFYETMPLPFEEWPHEETPSDSKIEGRGVAAPREEESRPRGVIQKNFVLPPSAPAVGARSGYGDTPCVECGHPAFIHARRGTSFKGGRACGRACSCNGFRVDDERDADAPYDRAREVPA